jgi:hypothetical protein
VGIDIDLNVTNIRHRHLLFRYRRQIYRIENCQSDIRGIPISTSEFILISVIYKKFLNTSGFEHSSLHTKCERYTTQLQYFSTIWLMLDIRYRIKLYSISDIMSDSALSVRYRKFRYLAQFSISLFTDIGLSAHL